ncbi:putative transcription regulator [Zopfia rhizophila CBS 207.26]|uniref:Putative transcription regulator n=1 Tax=Zopfia rhizophila CBS 207.26 TaxID=1314779 RepID=A0A6A6E0I4_9PEZI|nr:putative transcription regulator [Zopfia rhizophila CBS 207.26]
MGGGHDFPLHGAQLNHASDDPCRKPQYHPQYLRAVVDMGSNGIRFSISDLTPPTTRILPTLHVHRLDISLYDAQFDHSTGARIPIPKSTIKDVVAGLLRFQIICADFGVPSYYTRIIATEATRTAINCTEFLKEIRKATGLSVELLPEEDEGKIGAFGIASGFSDMEGIVIDLGGGSTQITWLATHEGAINISPKGAFSFPYGAAALTKKLEDLTKGKSHGEARKAKEKLRDEMKSNFLNAYIDLQVPKDIVERAQQQGGFKLYLSGGGFRGWGYLLLYRHQTEEHYYPISIINGFTVPSSDFTDTEKLKEVARTAKKIFRVSDRRRKQVPAVAFLISVLANALPHGIKEAHFCQGGVREGVLFQALPPRIRKQNPLTVATTPYAKDSATGIAGLLLDAIPKYIGACSSQFPNSISVDVIEALANILYVHSVMSKESSSSSALYSTSTGLLSSAHGVSHSNRALLALMLEESYEGELPPREVRYKSHLRDILEAKEVWWTCYIGKVALLLRRLYPSGFVDEAKPRVQLSARWTTDFGGGSSTKGIKLVFLVQKKKNDPMKLKETIQDHVGVIEKIGKRKNWIGGREGWGLAVEVLVEEECKLAR